ncbi:MAG TPA: hypothetical protein VF406_12650 [Thermodesulfobacteriota bacterium]
MSEAPNALQLAVEEAIRRRVRGTGFAIADRRAEPWGEQQIEVTFTVGDVRVDIAPYQVELVAADLYRAIEYRRPGGREQFANEVAEALWFFLQNPARRDALSVKKLRRLVERRFPGDG